MTTRPQVLFEDAEIRRVAKRHRMSVAEWVRQASRQARGEHPTADIQQMLTETRVNTASSASSESRVILIDSNIPMYLIGAPHPNKDTVRRLLEHYINRGDRLVADAEVLPEILHRYVAINRREAIQPAFDAVLRLVECVYPVEAADIEHAKTLLLGRTPLSARDAVHVAVMQRYDILRIMSFDAGFNHVPGLERVWR